MTPRFDVGQTVKTKSGLQGKIIGMALYAWGWEYRIELPNRKKTLYRRENEVLEA